MAEFRTPEVIGTVLTPIPIAGTIPVQGTVAVSAIAAIGTIGTILGGNVTATVSGGQLADVGTVGTLLGGNVTATVSGGVLQYIATIGTILFAPVVADIGTVGTILGGNVTATVSGGQLQYVGTVGTILGGNVTATVSGGVLADVGTIGTILSISAAIDMQQFSLSTIQNAATVTASGSSTILAATLQDLVVDTTYGTIYPATGSIQVYVAGVDPLSGFQTGSIVGGPWVAGTAPSAHRINAAGPLGLKVAVAWTVVTGTVAGFWVSAQQSMTS